MSRLPGQVAYEAYREAVGGRSLVTDDPLPDWNDQDVAIQRAWEYTAHAIAIWWEDNR